MSTREPTSEGDRWINRFAYGVLMIVMGIVVAGLITYLSGHEVELTKMRADVQTLKEDMAQIKGVLLSRSLNQR